jgi:transposase
MLFVGDDWAEDHHDVEIVDDAGRRLAAKRLPEGLDGITRLHALIARFAPADWAELDPGEAESRVKVGIETDRGPWVAALIAAGYEVFAINPLSTARYRQRHSTSGAKSDAGDAHVLAEIVRLDRAHHRTIAGDSTDSQAMKLVARSHQTLIWDRTRHVARLRSALREFFPAALAAFEDLGAPDALSLLAQAPDPDRGARLSKAKIGAALKLANRRDVAGRTEQIQAELRAPALRQPGAVQAAFAAIAAGEVSVIATLNSEIATLGEVVAKLFAVTRTLRSTPANPASAWCSVLGFLASSVMTGTATPMPGHARTTPGPHQSLEPPAPRKGFWPVTPATTDSATPSNGGPSVRCVVRPALGPITTPCELGRSATMLHFASSPTASSASCTAA